ncbi:unnamed protein product [Periconia digitata]|uniref:Uncharacterized protein n=1 Tax=Periconia digitata TaxID=1303443 RepID=A0A9W4XLJ5_9PLEO|nr:unnamed protein product [Periconia digitata]
MALHLPAHTTSTPAFHHRPWLHEILATHLHMGRTWLQAQAFSKETRPNPNPNREWAGIYEDNGSCLDIFVSEQQNTHRQVLQVIRENPLTLSDGEASVRASPDPDKHPASLFALGHYIALHTYTLQQTSYGPRRDKILIVPDTVTYLGKADLGDCSTIEPITKCEEVASALRGLHETRIALDRQCFFASKKPANIIMTPPQPNEGRAGQTQNTQVPFGTQMPPPSRTDQEDVVHLGTRRLEPVLAGTTRREELQSGVSQTKAKLLSMLQQAASRHEGPKVGKHHLPSKEAAPDSAEARNEMMDVDPAPTQRESFILADSSIEQIADGSVLTSSNEDELDNSVPTWLLPGSRPVCGSAKAHARQQEILMRPESWHKPGGRFKFPDANIPIEISAALMVKLRSSEEHVISSLDFMASQAPAGGADTTQDSIPARGSDPIRDPSPTQESDMISWATSPAPEPPQRVAQINMNLPPDSSMENRTSNSSEQKKALPSSPPEPAGVQGSDDEMEVDVPLGLGEELSVDMFRSGPPSEMVQVKETPYTKCKKIAPSLSQPEREPGDPYKGASSHSVAWVAGTYNDAQSPANFSSREARRDPVPADTAMDMISVNDKTMRIAEADTRSSSTSHMTTGFRADLKHEGGIEGGRSLCKSKEVKATAAKPVHVLRDAPLSVGVASTQVQVIEIDDSSSPPTKHSQPKRKLDHSPPSKRGIRGPKRREIKVSRRATCSPVRDVGARLREEKRKSLMSFREQRQFEATAANLPQSTRMVTSLDTEAGANSKYPLILGEDGEISTSPLEPSSVARNSSRHRTQTQMARGKDVTNTSFMSMQGRLEDINIDMDLYEYPNPDRPHETKRSSPLYMTIDGSNDPVSGHNNIPHSLSTTRQSTAQGMDSATTTIFHQFQVAYPGYTGDHKHFSNLCKKMISLDEDDRMVPKWLWDDYIIRNKTHYKPYADQCLTDGAEPEPYIRYYKDHVYDTMHKKGIIKTKETLLSALEELQTQSNSIRNSLRSFDAGSKPSEPKEELPSEPSRSSNGNLASAQPRSTSSIASPALNESPSQLIRSRNLDRDMILPRTANSIACESINTPVSRAKERIEEASNSPVPKTNPEKEPRRHSEYSQDPVDTPPSNSSATHKKKRRTLPSGWVPGLKSTATASSTSSPTPRPISRMDETFRTTSPVNLTSSIMKKPTDKPRVSSLFDNHPTTSEQRPPYQSLQSRPPFEASAFNRLSTTKVGLSSSSYDQKRPPQLHGKTGDTFRDFVLGMEGVTSFTGSTQIDPIMDWPDNLCVRPSIADVTGRGFAKKRYDVLEWGDVL